MKNNKNSAGFSLIELLLYIGIVAVVAGFLTGILIMTTRVHNQESADVEVTGQVDFVMQTINRLVRESSNIENATSTSLKLRMKDTAKDPTCVSLANGVIKLSEGPDTGNASNCSSATSDLTNSRVIVDQLSFKKFSQYPGHDTVSIDLQMSYNTQNPQIKVNRSIQSAISRVSAATFDSDVVPGGTYNFSLGQSGSPWTRIFMADGSLSAPPYTFSADSDTGFYRGGDNILRFVTGGTDRLSIGSDGRVGVGTTTPQSILDIAGSLYLKSNGVNSGELKVGYVTSSPAGYYAVYAP